MDQLLIALDVDRASRALELADSLRDLAGGFKIGSRLFTAEGPAVVRTLSERGVRVFLDLKFHDIPSTVGSTVASATRLGVWMVNVHASGGPDMMRAAKDAAAEAASAAGLATPLVIGVTVLTSMNQSMLREVGVGCSLESHVGALASLAQRSGLDGVVASPLEIDRVRKVCGPDFAIVTPGIRDPSDRRTSSRDDQVRTLSAAEALRHGASYVVVGRPIIGASDPRKAAERIAAEMS